MEVNDLQKVTGDLADLWVKMGEWQHAGHRDVVDFVLQEAHEAFDKYKRATAQHFVRNNPRPVKLEQVDEEMADTMIMAFRWFILRGRSAEDAIVNKLSAMHVQRCPQIKPENYFNRS